MNYILILFVFLYADDTLVLSDNPKDFQEMVIVLTSNARNGS